MSVGLPVLGLPVLLLSLPLGKPSQRQRREQRGHVDGEKNVAGIYGWEIKRPLKHICLYTKV